MKIVVANVTSGSGDEHCFDIALFTTTEKAEDFIKKLKARHPGGDFAIHDHIPLIVDPVNLEDSEILS